MIFKQFIFCSTLVIMWCAERSTSSVGIMGSPSPTSPTGVEDPWRGSLLVHCFPRFQRRCPRQRRYRRQCPTSYRRSTWPTSSIHSTCGLLMLCCGGGVLAGSNDARAPDSSWVDIFVLPGLLGRFPWPFWGCLPATFRPRCISRTGTVCGAAAGAAHPYIVLSKPGCRGLLLAGRSRTV